MLVGFSVVLSFSTFVLLLLVGLNEKRWFLLKNLNSARNSSLIKFAKIKLGQFLTDILKCVDGRPEKAAKISKSNFSSRTRFFPQTTFTSIKFDSRPDLVLFFNLNEFVPWFNIEIRQFSGLFSLDLKVNNVTLELKFWGSVYHLNIFKYL